VCAILPGNVPLSDELDVGLINQGGRLQTMASSLSAHVVAGQAAQFRIDERYQFIERFFVAIAPFNQQVRDLL